MQSSRAPAPRRPWLAFLLALLAPGLGQLYAGSPRGALLAVVAWTLLAAGAIVLFIVPLGPLFLEPVGDHRYRIAVDPALDHYDPPALVVPPERYFLLGDNRDDSYDSRIWGTVHRSDVMAPVSHVYWSRDPDSAGVAWARIGLRVE